MKIYEDYSSTYDDAIDHYWDLKKFSTESDDTAAFIGWAYMDKISDHIDTIRKYQNAVYFNTEHPCVFQGTDESSIALSSDSNKLFNKIFTQCPYTADWLNYKEQGDRFKHIYIPFNLQYVCEPTEQKVYDALYWGGIHNVDHINILDVIKNYKYNFLSVGPNTWSGWNSEDRWLQYLPKEGVVLDHPGADPYHYMNLLTSINMERTAMWQLLRKTKVNVMTNLLYTDKNINTNIRLHDQWEENKAFSHLEYFIMPQLKTRPIETAVNKCLMVVKKDPWNIQELYFEPEKEFIYYEDKKDLQSILEDVKINWKNYEQIVENAFSKAISNYTTRHFVDELRKECK